MGSTGLYWTEGKPSADPVRCIGCNRLFLTWGAFDLHGSEGSCAYPEKMRKLGLRAVGKFENAVWKLEE